MPSEVSRHCQRRLTPISGGSRGGSHAFVERSRAGALRRRRPAVDRDGLRVDGATAGAAASSNTTPVLVMRFRWSPGGAGPHPERSRHLLQLDTGLVPRSTAGPRGRRRSVLRDCFIAVAIGACSSLASERVRSCSCLLHVACWRIQVRMLVEDASTASSHRCDAVPAPPPGAGATAGSGAGSPRPGARSSATPRPG